MYADCNTNGDFKVLESNIEVRDNVKIVGFIQYCLNGTWRTICTGNGVIDNWDTTKATIACIQLGYSDQGE